MKTFISGGVKFYTLEAGDYYPDPNADNQYVGAYAVFLHEGEWVAQIHEKGHWLDLTPRRFESENEAFNFAYDHYIAAQAKIQARFRSD